MGDDDARILVADGNLHREKISTYDQSRALRMKMDSMKHKSGRRKKGETAVGKTDEVLAGEMGISTAKLHRLMRLSDASREICGMIDDGRLTLSVASAISQLKPANQAKLADLIDIGLKPSADQVERMRKAEASGRLTEKAMRDIIDNKDIAPKEKPAPVTPPPAPMTTSAPASPTPSMAPAPSGIPKSPDVAAPAVSAPNVVPFSTVTAHNHAEENIPSKPAETDPFVGRQERPEETKVILRGDRLRKYFPDVNMTPREIEDKVYMALDFYQKHQEKQKQKAAIFDKGKGGSAR
ncbi:MAG: ParB/RepB/Spo0J family partition protein [Oscillospiraceae bacterium]